ncbi:MAG: NACHT domain-containing protein, partial [Acidobacteria bacterium]|nr:NACHT domain-containing protein [Acidobacteriota bacterium]
MKDTGEIDTLRAREIAYLEMLREEEKLDRTKYYTPLSGQSVPVIEPEYEYTPFQPIDFEDEGPRRFADAAGEILRLKRAVVLGEPGAGKTTTLWKLAGDMIEQVQANPKAPLPLLIRLGRWIEEKEPFTDFLRRQLVELGPFLDQLLKQNRAVLLLDGLNELPAGQRKRKTGEIRELLKSWPKVRVVISCRQLDYDENDLQMDRIEIVPLDPIRIRQFVCGYLGEQKGERLFWKLAGGTAQETYEQLRVNFEGEPAALPELFWIGIDCPLGISSWMWTRWIRVRENPSSLLVLARNPFMLTMLYSLYGKEDALPENRVILFDLFVRQLLKREKVAKGAQALILQQIARLAYEMQTRRTTEKQGDALTVVPRSEVLKTLDDRNLGIAVRASLVSPGEEVRFTHQLLQEYFA